MKKSIVCERCGKTFRDRSGLAGHLQFSSCGLGTSKLNTDETAPTTDDGLFDVTKQLQQQTQLNKAKLSLATSEKLLNENKEIKEPKNNNFWNDYKEQLEIMLMEERIKDLRESRNRKHDSNDGNSTEILTLRQELNQLRSEMSLQKEREFQNQMRQAEAERFKLIINNVENKIESLKGGNENKISELKNELTALKELAGLFGEKKERSSGELAKDLVVETVGKISNTRLGDAIGNSIENFSKGAVESMRFQRQQVQPQIIEEQETETLMGQKLSTDYKGPSATMQVINAERVPATDGNGTDDFGIVWSEDRSHATTPDGKYFNVEKFDETNLEKFQTKYMTTPTTNILANEIVEETVAKAKDEDVDLFAGGEVLLK
jgi:hypothetical protein